jgi:aminoglycoside phosphotransferase (APT) family kinase protein
MPYPIESFLLDAGPGDRQKLQDLSIEVVAEIHKTPIGTEESAFLEYDYPGETALRRHVNSWIEYRDWVVGDRDIPLINEAFQWLEDNWPTEADQRPPVLSWGDSRIGNMMYRDFEPVAVFDWEMAGIAPPEVDLGWMSYMHKFFQDVTVDLGLPGMPDYMDPGEVRDKYMEASGREISDLHWFRVYNAARHAAIMMRITDRQVFFGEAEPSDPEVAIVHSRPLREMIS